MLRADQGFHFALECLSGSYLQEDWRLATTLIWAGIEALIHVSTEVTYRLSITVAALLEHPGAERVALYKQIKKLYGLRSRVVHGDDVSDVQLHDHVVSARAVLKKCLQRIVEVGSAPTAEQLEAMVLGVPLPMPRP